MYGSVAQYHRKITYDGHELGPSSSIDIAIDTKHEISHGGPSNTGKQPSGVRTDEAMVRCVLEEAGVVGNNEPVMSIVEMRAFVRGRLKR